MGCPWKVHKAILTCFTFPGKKTITAFSLPFHIHFLFVNPRKIQLSSLFVHAFYLHELIEPVVNFQQLEFVPEIKSISLHYENHCNKNSPLSSNGPIFPKSSHTRAIYSVNHSFHNLLFLARKKLCTFFGLTRPHVTLTAVLLHTIIQLLTFFTSSFLHVCLVAVISYPLPINCNMIYRSTSSINLFILFQFLYLFFRSLVKIIIYSPKNAFQLKYVSIPKICVKLGFHATVCGRRIHYTFFPTWHACHRRKKQPIYPGECSLQKYFAHNPIHTLFHSFPVCFPLRDPSSSQQKTCPGVHAKYRKGKRAKTLNTKIKQKGTHIHKQSVTNFVFVPSNHTLVRRR